MKRKVIFLDRDGTIIVDRVYLNDPNQIEFFPRAAEALRLLAAQGFEFVVVTNQSGVARKLVQLHNLHTIHQRISQHLATQGLEILGYYYAPYSVESNHFERKPNPGMLFKAAKDHTVDLSKCWMIGDRMSDVEAGATAGTKTVLLGEKEVALNPKLPTFVVNSLWEAAQKIIVQT